MGFSVAQRKALSILPKLTGVSSILCSSLIVFSVLRDPKKRAKIYHRLLLGISLVDISNSLWFGLSTWPIPRESGAMFAAGTPETCTMQGFFIQAGIAMCFYNESLALYYALVLRYGWSEAKLRPLEPFLHAIPLLWGLSTAIVSIPLELFNNANLWCWIAPYPAGCQGEDCIRGANADWYRWGFYYGPLWLNIFGITTLMVLVFRHVSHVGKEVNTNDDDDDENDNTNSFLLEETNENGENTITGAVATSSRSVRRDVLIQCFLYTGSFYLNWIWLTAVRIIQAADFAVPFPLLAMAAVAAPLQGMPNLCVYLFPKFLSVREANPHAGVFRWLQESL